MSRNLSINLIIVIICRRCTVTSFIFRRYGGGNTVFVSIRQHTAVNLCGPRQFTVVTFYCRMTNLFTVNRNSNRIARFYIATYRTVEQALLCVTLHC